jgi:fused signal recognition particle receptor
MRAMFLFFLLCSFVGAAEMEYIKLKDGRTFTGLYDETKGTIEVTTGKAKAIFPIKADEIVLREAIAARPADRNFIQEAATLDQQLKDAAARREKDAAEQLLREQAASVEAEKLVRERAVRLAEQKARDEIERRELQAKELAAQEAFARNAAEAEQRRIDLAQDRARQDEARAQQQVEKARIIMARQQEERVAKEKERIESEKAWAEFQSAAADREQKRQTRELTWLVMMLIGGRAFLLLVLAIPHRRSSSV